MPLILNEIAALLFFLFYVLEMVFAFQQRYKAYKADSVDKFMYRQLQANWHLILAVFFYGMYIYFDTCY